MWLEDNRNAHGSAKTKYENMKMRDFFSYLKAKELIHLSLLEITWHFISLAAHLRKQNRKKTSTDKKCHHSTLSFSWLWQWEPFAKLCSRPEKQQQKRLKQKSTLEQNVQNADVRSSCLSRSVSTFATMSHLPEKHWICFKRLFLHFWLSFSAAPPPLCVPSPCL